MKNHGKSVNEEDQGARLVRYTLGVLLGGAVALGACFLLLLLASMGISSGALPQEAMYQITIVSCVVGSFLGGTIAVRRCQARALIVGLLTGAAFFLVLLTIGVLLFEAAPDSRGIGLLCGSLLGGAAAGLLCSGGKKGRSKHKRRK